MISLLVGLSAAAPSSSTGEADREPFGVVAPAVDVPGGLSIAAHRSGAPRAFVAVEGYCT